MTQRQQQWIDKAQAHLDPLTVMDDNTLTVCINKIFRIGDADHLHAYLTNRGFAAGGKAHRYSNGEYHKTTYTVPTDDYLERRTAERRAEYLRICGKTPEQLGDPALA